MGLGIACFIGYKFGQKRAVEQNEKTFALGYNFGKFLGYERAWSEGYEAGRGVKQPTGPIGPVGMTG